MATREENLKKIHEKINEELEKLSDEELEAVASGDLFDEEWEKFEKVLKERGIIDTTED